jgi:hypothetical protein
VYPCGDDSVNKMVESGEESGSISRSKIADKECLEMDVSD